MRVALLVILLILVSTDALFNHGRFTAEVMHRGTIAARDIGRWGDQVAASVLP